MSSVYRPIDLKSLHISADLEDAPLNLEQETPQLTSPLNRLQFIQYHIKRK